MRSDSLEMTKPKFVIFEGADKVGKSTLYRAYRKATKFGPLAIDRFTGSNWVYDKFYKRETQLEAFIDSEGKLTEIYDCYLVLVSASKNTVLDRILKEETGLDQTIALDNYDKVMDLFEEYRGLTGYKNIIKINTSLGSLQENLNRILEFTGELQIKGGCYNG